MKMRMEHQNRSKLCVTERDTKLMFTIYRAHNNIFYLARDDIQLILIATLQHVDDRTTIQRPEKHDDVEAVHVRGNSDLDES